MKLLFCLECHDLFNLSYREKSCSCGACSGRYVNSIDAVVNGCGVSLAIGTGSLQLAIARLAGMAGDRKDFIENNSVLCWVRPHEGQGNPHTRVLHPEPAAREAP